jgi:hypothetical protein
MVCRQLGQNQLGQTNLARPFFCLFLAELATELGQIV